MKFLNKLIGGNVLLKVTSINSFSVIIQLICGFAISKAIAIFVGPQGMTLIGNLRNLLGTVQQLGILGMYNGVVKYTADLKGDKPELKKVFSTASFFGLIATLSVALLLFFTAEFVSILIFENTQYASIIRTLAVVLPFHSLNFLCLAIINGFSKYRLKDMLATTFLMPFGNSCRTSIWISL